jgi:hypothetical protein
LRSEGNSYPIGKTEIKVIQLKTSLSKEIMTTTEKSGVNSNSVSFDLGVRVYGPGTTRLGFFEDRSSHRNLRRQTQLTVNKNQVKIAELVNALQKSLLHSSYETTDTSSGGSPLTHCGLTRAVEGLASKNWNKQKTKREDSTLEEALSQKQPQRYFFKRPFSQSHSVIRSGDDLSSLRITNVALRASSAYRERLEDPLMPTTHPPPLETVLRKRNKPKKYTHEKYRSTLASFKKMREEAKQNDARRAKNQQSAADLGRMKEAGSMISRSNQASTFKSCITRSFKENGREFRAEKSAASSMRNTKHVSIATPLPKIYISQMYT